MGARVEGVRDGNKVEEGEETEHRRLGWGRGRRRDRGKRKSEKALYLVAMPS